MPTPRETLDQLNRTYVGLHTPKEDAFWSAYMGLTDDPKAARADLDTKEIALKRFVDGNIHCGRSGCRTSKTGEPSRNIRWLRMRGKRKRLSITLCVGRRFRG